MRTPLPQETLDHIIGYYLDITEELYIYQDNDLRNYFLTGHALVRFIKVCKAWRFAGNRHLYQTLIICTDFEDKSVRRYLPNVCRSLEENPSLRGLVKKVVIKNIFDDEEGLEDYFKDLLTLCSSARDIVLGGYTPEDVGSFHKILAGMKMRKLMFRIRMGEEGFFFSRDTDMIHFITTLPDIEDVCLVGNFDMFPETSIPGWDSDDENCEGRRGRPLHSPPMALEVKTYTTLPLTRLNIYSSGVVSEAGLKLLTTLTLPYLREFRICFVAEEEADKLLLECLAKWPKGIHTLELRRDGPGYSNQRAEFAKALDQFPDIKEFCISMSMVSLDYILSRSTVTKVVIYDILDDEEFENLASKLIEMENGPTEKVPVYLPLLEHLTFYLEHYEVDRRYDCFEYCRMRRVRIERKHRMDVTMNIYCMTKKTWHKIPVFMF